jgi:Circularly permutated YpsA SLOG family
LLVSMRHACCIKPCVLPSDVVSWLRSNPEIKCLNIAGNRESKNPGIGERVERFMTVVFTRVNAGTDA